MTLITICATLCFILVWISIVANNHGKNEILKTARCEFIDGQYQIRSDNGCLSEKCQTVEKAWESYKLISSKL